MPLAFSVSPGTVPTNWTPYTFVSLAIKPLDGSDTVSVLPATTEAYVSFTATAAVNAPAAGRPVPLTPI